MAVEYYLNVAGMSGDSTAKDHPGAFDVAGFSFESEKPVSIGVTGPNIGKPEFGPLTIEFSDQTGLTRFLETMSRGSAVSGASLVGVQTSATGPEVETYRVNLAHLLVTDVEATSDGGYAVKLDYGQIGVITHDVRPDGTAAAAQQFGYDVVNLTSITPPPNVNPGGSTTPVRAPTQYFALIDGVNGGSTDKAHTGWFDLTGFDLHGAAPATLSSGGGGSQAAFDPITLKLPSEAALADLMSSLAHGAHLDGIKIEGVAAFGDNVRPVYDLSLAGVVVQGITHDNTGGVEVTLDYSKIQLTTPTLGLDGSVSGPPSVYSWDTINNAPARSSDFPQITAAVSADGGRPDTFYLSVSGISGDSLAKNHTGAFEVAAFSFDDEAPVTTGATELVPGKAQFGELKVTIGDETGLAKFLDAMAKGLTIDGASLVGTRTTATLSETELYRANLAELHVTSVEEAPDQGYTVTLQYGQIGVATHALSPDGHLGATQQFAWDQSTGSTIPMPPDVTTSGAAAVPASKFFAVIDGLNGGSTDKAHAGWFDLTGFDLQGANPVRLTSTGGGGAGKAHFENITLKLANQAALADLMTTLGHGGSLGGIRIEGVANSTVDGPQPAVYDLSLAGAYVTSVQQDDSGGLSVDVAYSKIQLVTQGVDARGDLAPGQTTNFSWDIAQNAPASPSDFSASPGGNLDGDHPQRYFLTVAGIAGDSGKTDPPGAFAVQSFEVDTQLPVTIGGPTTSVGAPRFGALHVTVGDETGLAKFLDALANGKTLSGASLVGLQSTAAGPDVESYRLNLADVHVTDVHEASGGYAITLAYGQIGVRTQDVRPDGTLGASKQFGYDVALNQSITPPPSIIGGASAGPVAPTHFYALIDGLNGGSHDKQHPGWFDVADFSFGSENPFSLSSTGGGGAGKARFDSITLTLPNRAALTDLMSKLTLSPSVGGVLDGVRIEGMAATTDGGAAAVYDLNLAKVFIDDVTQDDTGAIAVKLDFTEVELTTTVPGGTAASKQTFAWNIAENTPANPSDFPQISPGSTATPPPAPGNLALDAASDTGVLGDGLTRSHQLVIDGAAQAGASVTVYDGSTAVGTAVAGSDGAFRVTTSSLADGLHTLTATAANAGGASGQSSGLTVTIDSVAPDAPKALADAAIVDGFVNKANDTADQALTGTADAGAVVTVYDGTTQLGTATADANGAWSYKLGALGEGQHSFTATATDAAGNVGVASTALTFTVDLTPPNAPTGLADTAIAGSYVNKANDSADQALTGTAEANAVVTVYDGAIQLGTATAAANGAWSYTLGALKEGAHSFTATATDAAGNVGAASAPLTFTVDLTPPNAPTGLGDTAIANVYVNKAHDTADQALTGTAEPGAIVTVYDGTTWLGTAATDTNGAWSYKLGVLGEGAHSLTATATDAAGNVGAASTALAFTVDVTPPNAPTGLADAAIVGGYVNKAHDTDAQALTGTTEAGAVVTVYDGANLLGTTTADANGAWSYKLGALGEGQHSLTATATDAAGNVGAASTALAFTVDVTPPSAPTGLADTAIAGGYVNKAHDSADQALTGTAEANAVVTVYDGATQLGTTTADANGAWSYKLGALDEGQHSLTATATDAAGNVGAASTALAFTVDVTPPNAPTGLADTAVVGGYVNKAHDADAQALTGTTEAGAVVTVYDGTTQLGTTTADANGAWSYKLGVLAEGSHSLTATATDAAGNLGAASSALTFTVDVTPPTAPTGLADAAIVGGYVNAAHDTAAQALTGQAEAGALVTVYDGATKLGVATANGTGAWSFGLGVLPDGQHSLTAVASDAAGNLSPASGALAFTVDTTPPTPTATDVVSGSGGAGIGGVSDPGTTVVIYDGGTAIKTVVADANGVWKTDLVAPGNTIHAYTFQTTDLAGNVGTSPGVTLYTPASNKALVGGAGDDVLIGRPNDVLTGGGGHDTFVFNPGFGKETVTDFKPAGASTPAGSNDVLAFAKSLFADSNAVLAHARQVGADTLITYDGGDVVTLKNVTLSSLHDGDFTFV